MRHEQRYVVGRRAKCEGIIWTVSSLGSILPIRVSHRQGFVMHSRYNVCHLIVSLIL